MQAGKAGGSDPIKEAVGRVQPQGRKTFLVGFSHDGTFLPDPFMITITCKS